MDTLSLILMIIGAINWGLVGIFQFGGTLKEGIVECYNAS